MINPLQESLWKHFGASIDTFINALLLYPDEYWITRKKFFYTAYHTLVFLDYYLTIPPKDFSPPLPYTLTDPEHIPREAIDDIVPNEIYTKQQLLDYAQYCRDKCRKVIAGLTTESINKRWLDDAKDMNLDLASSSSINYSVLDILLYNMRHVQHHAAQLNLLLRQEINTAGKYVSDVKDKL
jgi:hypothetical protein